MGPRIPLERHGPGAGTQRTKNLEGLMLEIFTRKRLSDAETELRRIRHILEGMQNDAVARGVLLNEIYALLKERKKDDA